MSQAVGMPIVTLEVATLKPDATDMRHNQHKHLSRCLGIIVSTDPHQLMRTLQQRHAHWLPCQQHHKCQPNKRQQHWLPGLEACADLPSVPAIAVTGVEQWQIV